MNRLETKAAGSNLIVANGNEPLIVSSREIAEACEKRHDHVMRDITKMLKEIGKDAPKYGGMYEDAYGREKPCYFLPKDLTMTLITGYRADLRFKMVKRIEELEEAAKPVALTGQQLMAAALIEAQATIQAAQAEVADMREDVKAHQRITKADGSLNITEAAKNLGIRPKDLFDWIGSHGWIYKRRGGASWLGYASHCNNGDLEHKTTTVTRADGSEKITEQVRVTGQGLSKLAKLIPPTASPA